ncbi:MAG: 50S ribosomal protein L25 [Crocinitomicaceae bacterium]|nr:50S ribosomal protein L25 [Crocinitomicaceae bacterium]
MKVAKLSGSVRTSVGKKGSHALRAADLVPCVIYGQGTQVHFSAKKNDIEKIVFSPEVYQIELDIDGDKHEAIIQDIQQDPIRGTVRHIDFYKIDAKKPVKVGLPVRVTGSSRGVMAGGKLSQVFRRLTVIALPGDLPDAIIVDISPLRIGQAIRVSQIENENLKIVEDSRAVVVSVKMSRGASKDAQDDDEEEAAE